MVAGRRAVAALLAPLRAAGAGLAAPLLPGSRRGAALGEAQPFVCAGAEAAAGASAALPPPRPGCAPAGMGWDSGAPCGRCTRDVCLSVCPSLAVTARPASEAPLEPLEKWEQNCE